jgi:hypothetical protein
MSDPALKICSDAADRMDRRLRDNGERTDVSKKRQQEQERASWDRANEMLRALSERRNG